MGGGRSCFFFVLFFLRRSLAVFRDPLMFHARSIFVFAHGRCFYGRSLVVYSRHVVLRKIRYSVDKGAVVARTCSVQHVRSDEGIEDEETFTPVFGRRQ